MHQKNFTTTYMGRKSRCGRLSSIGLTSLQTKCDENICTVDHFVSRIELEIIHRMDTKHENIDFCHEWRRRWESSSETIIFPTQC